MPRRGSAMRWRTSRVARSCIYPSAIDRLYNGVDLVNRLERRTVNGRQRRLANHLSRKD